MSGFGETALAAEALSGGSEAVSGMDLAADAGMGGANAVGGGALSSYGTSAMDLSSPEAANLPQNLSNIPTGQGVPKSIALNDTQQAINAANSTANNAIQTTPTAAPAAANVAGNQAANAQYALNNGITPDYLPPGATSANTGISPDGSFPTETSYTPSSGIAGASGAASSPGILSQAYQTWNKLSTGEKVAIGSVGALAAMMAGGAFKANFMDTYKPQTAGQVGLGRTLSPQYKPTLMAGGGITSLAVGGMPGQQYPMSQINYNGYNTPTQMPTSAMQMAGYQPSNMPLQGALQQNMASGGSTSGSAGITAAGESTGNGLNIYTPQTSNNTSAQLAALASQYGVSLPTTMAAEGGIMALSSGGHTDGTYNLGGYSDGGRLLKGPGDGMSDHIPASIADKQPARLADGEFVVPADVVSHLGNGSTDAGARHLYSMMDKVRKARTGNTKQGKQIQPEKYLPA